MPVDCAGCLPCPETTSAFESSSRAEGRRTPCIRDWVCAAYAIRDTTPEQRERAEAGCIDIVFRRMGHAPIGLCHEELPLVRTMCKRRCKSRPR